MNDFYPPVLIAPSEIAAAFDSICMPLNSLEALEQLAYKDDLEGLPLLASSEWGNFAADVRKAFITRDHLIIRGLPVSTQGATLLLAARTIGSKFRTYRKGQIIKHFKMSPWTSELSHTTREGEFHTDLNTEPTPPAITAMQCLDPDPGAPRYGNSRVSRLTDLLAFLKKRNDIGTLRFLTQDTVTMLNDHSLSSWSGNIVKEGVIRYHPATLRAAAQRAGHSTEKIESLISSLAEAALAVSEPFNMDRGDVLLLSNHRALHYRGECSVLFIHYPTEFVSRSIFILHTSQES